MDEARRGGMGVGEGGVAPLSSLPSPDSYILANKQQQHSVVSDRTRFNSSLDMERRTAF